MISTFFVSLIFKKIFLNKIQFLLINITSFIPFSLQKSNKIFENKGFIHDNLLTLHLWNSYSEKYYKNIINFNWCDNNESLYSLLVKNVYNIFFENS